MTAILYRPSIIYYCLWVCRTSITNPLVTRRDTFKTDSFFSRQIAVTSVPARSSFSRIKITRTDWKISAVAATRLKCKLVSARVVPHCLNACFWQRSSAPNRLKSRHVFRNASLKTRRICYTKSYVERNYIITRPYKGCARESFHTWITLVSFQRTHIKQIHVPTARVRSVMMLRAILTAENRTRVVWMAKRGTFRAPADLKTKNRPEKCEKKVSVR